MKKRISLLLICLLVIFCNICAVPNMHNFKFRTLSPDGGLGYIGANAIRQDKFGFIWVLMRNELYRYDGYTYKRYFDKIKQADEKGTLSNINDLEEDEDGNILVGTPNGIFRFNRQADKFELFNRINVYGMKRDSLGNFWIANSEGVFLLDKSESTPKLLSKFEVGKPISSTAFYDFGKKIIITKDFGKIYLFDKSAKKMKVILQLPLITDIIDVGVIKDKLWILTENQGLWKINLADMTIEKRYTFFCSTGNERVPTKDLFIDKYNNIWIATQKGLYVMDSNTGDYERYTHSDVCNSSIINNSIWNINSDRQGNIWIGTYSGGLSYFNFDQYDQFKAINVQSTKLSHVVVSVLAEYGNTIWIGTEGNGLFAYEKTSGLVREFRHDPHHNSLAYDNVKGLYVDRVNNKLWIGMYRGGIDCLDLKTLKFKNISKGSLGCKILDNDVLKFEPDDNMGFWIVYQNLSNNLSFMSTVDSKITDYTLNKHSLVNLSGKMIKDAVKGNNDEIWISSTTRLQKFNYKTGVLKNVYLQEHDSKSSGSPNIETLFWNYSQGTLWLGTTNNGLIKYDPVKNVVQHLLSAQREDMHSIYSIEIDNKNNLWMGTDNGLFRFETKSGRLIKYSKEDGLQGHLFLPNSCAKSSTGELYFGGTEGFTIVSPDKMVYNSYQPDVLITDLYIDNKIVEMGSFESPLKESITTSDKITLDYNQKNFGFQFTSTNFLIPDKVRFRYRLVGYDNDWIEVGAQRRYISYAKVPDGKYTLEIKACNNDGLWSSKIRTLEIRILPAPWNTWWAYLIYLLLTALICYAVLFYYLRNKRLQMELIVESEKKKQQDENYQFQFQFFTNISHEFKTPLSLIIGVLERLKQESLVLPGKYMAILENNSKRLLNLISELMDFRAVEAGSLSLNVFPTDLNIFVDKNASDFKELAQQKEIDFQVVFDNNLDAEVPFDKKIIEKIIMNLLNNAFKYTDKGGRIKIETISNVAMFKSDYQTSFNVNKSGVLTDKIYGILVQDTGIGISVESISKVFERFYMVNDYKGDSHLGSGIGLTLVKSLVLLHKGYIEICSEKGKGTDILVAFPYSYDNYDIQYVDEGSPGYSPSKLDYMMEAESAYDYTMADEDYLLNEKKRILIVEDNDDLRNLVAESLEKYFDIIQAPNGDVATVLIDKNEISLIISDIMMPVKDGVTLCREVKSNLETSHIPFIMMTAKSGLENKIEGLDSGADSYIEKPVNLKLLLLTIENIFKQQTRVKEFYSKNFYAENTETNINQRENEFMKLLIEVIEARIDQSDMDINYIAVELAMSRSKLYAKVKSLTGKSIVEFIRHYRLRKAVKLMIEEDLPIREVMDRVGIESQSYFTRAFKKEFGDNPTTFVAKMRQGKSI